MKRNFILFIAGVIILGMNSCKKDSSTLITKTESVSMGAGYVDDIYYRLSDGVITSVPRSNWDLAFSVSPREAAILANSTSGVTLKAYPSSGGMTMGSMMDSTTDTTGFHSWPVLFNSDTTWADGAFNMNATGHPNYGWGVYSEMTHNLAGVVLYIMKTRNGDFKKIWIENKMSVEQKYTFSYSDLDGTNKQTVTLDCAGKNKNFMYYSVDSGAEVDREPETNMWDIVFTKYVDKSINYPVTGCLQNIGVTAQESPDTDPLSESMPMTGYMTNISTIGSDWKTIDIATYQYSIDDTRVFFVKDQNDKIYRITFKTFEGSSTGKVSFDVSVMK